MKVLEELFYGNVSIYDRDVKQDSELKHSMELVCKTDERLVAMLNDEQQKALKKYKENYLEMCTLSKCDIFIKGFSLGLRMATESFNEDFCKI